MIAAVSWTMFVAVLMLLVAMLALEINRLRDRVRTLRVQLLGLVRLLEHRNEMDSLTYDVGHARDSARMLASDLRTTFPECFSERKHWRDHCQLLEEERAGVTR